MKNASFNKDYSTGKGSKHRNNQCLEPFNGTEKEGFEPSRRVNDLHP